MCTELRAAEDQGETLQKLQGGEGNKEQREIGCILETRGARAHGGRKEHRPGLQQEVQ